MSPEDALEIVLRGPRVKKCTHCVGGFVMMKGNDRTRVPKDHSIDTVKRVCPVCNGTSRHDPDYARAREVLELTG